MGLAIPDALGDAVHQTVLMLCGVDAHLDLGEVPESDAPAEVSGVIGFTGRARGTINIAFPLELAAKFASLRFETSPKESSEEQLVEYMTEMTNIVAGNLMALFNDTGEGIETRLSLPSVIVGGHRILRSQGDGPTENVLFETEFGLFTAGVQLSEITAVVRSNRTDSKL